MIILSEVATKLEQILNSNDSPLKDNYYFRVETEGFHIDHIMGPQEIEQGENNEISAIKQRNFIPVFISSMGGQFNPVKGLKQGSYVIPIVFYYPVRFKDDFFAFGDFLVDTFVGTILNYGAVSGKAVSNISVPQFGEIQDLDFKEFKEWVSDKYTMAIEKMEPYISMEINLYLTNSASGLLYGNDVKVDFSFTGSDNVKYTLENIDWDGASLQSNSQATPEQEEDALIPESEAFPFGTAYGSSFKIYPNLNKLAKDYTNVYFYRKLLKEWLDGKIQNVKTEVTFTIGDPSYGLSYTRKCFIQSVVAPIEKGQLFALTLTFAKLIEEE